MQASSPQLARPNASQHMRLQALPRNAAKPMMARRAVFSQALRVQHTETLSTQLLSSLPAGLQVSTTALAYTSLSTAILVGASYASRSQLVLLLAAVLAVIGYQLRQQPQQPSTSDATTAKGGSVRILSEATRPKEAVIGQAASQLIAQQVTLARAKPTSSNVETRALDAMCMARALEHTNHVKAVEIRSMRTEIVHLQLRIEKLRKDPAAFDVPSDPAEERLAKDIVQSNIVHSLEVELANARHENVQLRAQLQKQQVMLEKHGLHLV